MFIIFEKQYLYANMILAEGGHHPLKTSWLSICHRLEEDNLGQVPIDSKLWEGEKCMGR